MGALVFFNAEHRILISGDALWENGFGFVMPPEIDPAAMPAALATLDMLAALDARVVIPGHGEPFGNVAEAIARARRRAVAFAADSQRTAWHGMKVILAFSPAPPAADGARRPAAVRGSNGVVPATSTPASSRCRRTCWRRGSPTTWCARASRGATRAISSPHKRPAAERSGLPCAGFSVQAPAQGSPPRSVGPPQDAAATPCTPRSGCAASRRRRAFATARPASSPSPTA